MLWLGKYIFGLSVVALAPGCGAEWKPTSSKHSATADLIPEFDAKTIRTHPGGTVAATLRSAGRPFGLAVSRTGLVYCTLLDAASLVRTTLQGDSLTPFPVDQVPTDVAFSPDGNWAYVTNQWAQTVGIVDTRTNRQVDAVALPGDPYRVLVGPEGQVVYVTTNTGNLVVVDPSMRRIDRTIHLGGTLNGLALNAGGTRLYVSDVGGAIFELDTAGDVLRKYAVEGRPQGMALSEDGRELYVAGEDGDFIVLNLQNADLGIVRVALGAGGFGLAVTPDQSQVWITAPAAGRVFVLDRVSRTVRSIIALGGTPRRLAFDRSGSVAVIADEAGAIRFVR